MMPMISLENDVEKAFVSEDVEDEKVIVIDVAHELESVVVKAFAKMHCFTLFALKAMM